MVSGIWLQKKNGNGYRNISRDDCDEIAAGKWFQEYGCKKKNGNGYRNISRDDCDEIAAGKWFQEYGCTKKTEMAAEKIQG